MNHDPVADGGTVGNPGEAPVVKTERFLSESVEHTEAVAEILASELRAGDCVALSGDLGAGKTQFTRGLARAFGVDPREVSSPTFVLLNIYRGRSLQIYHLDAYRAGGSDDLEAIGFTELLDSGGIVIVEWAERIRSLLPANTIDVRLETTSQTGRAIAISRLESPS